VPVAKHVGAHPTPASEIFLDLEERTRAGLRLPVDRLEIAAGARSQLDPRECVTISHAGCEAEAQGR
jgi:hypothetical protein